MLSKRDDNQFEMGNLLQNDEAGREAAAADNLWVRTFSGGVLRQPSC
jgi:hypothetical protein